MNASTAGQASDAADLWRDAWGIPHIKTRTRDEAFAALGFAHARDRLWQMEALLRRGTGHYAEWVGESAIKAVTQWVYAPAPSRTTIQVSVPFDPR